MPSSEYHHHSIPDANARRASRLVIRIATMESDPPILFAAAELERCLQRMTGAPAVHVRGCDVTSEPDALWLGTPASLVEVGLPPVDNPELDDAIAVRVADLPGGIGDFGRGACPRHFLPLESSQVTTHLVSPRHS